jgi:hypothetical protein
MQTDVTKYLVFIVYCNYYEQAYKNVSWDLIYKKENGFPFFISA